MGGSTKGPSIFAGEQPPEFDIKPPVARKRFTKSTFGPQILSSKVTEPSVRFGRGCRISMEKLYIDAELTKLTPGQSPGPAYVLVPSVGKQVKSEMVNTTEVGFPVARRFIRFKGGEAPGPGAYDKNSSFGDQVLSYQKSPEKAVIGSSTRKQQQKVYLSQDFNKSLYGLESPGPVVCDLRSSLGGQCHSENKSAPNVKFTMDKRFKDQMLSVPQQKSLPTNGTPGAGQYKNIAAIGKQPLSSRLNQPKISFTQAKRDQRAKIFISQEHERVNVGLASPGPAVNIKVLSSLGQQPSSKKVNPPSWSFSGAKRFRRVYEELPGPGEYDC